MSDIFNPHPALQEAKAPLSEADKQIGPFPGDIRLCNPERDKDKPLSQIHDFEIWIGGKWVHWNTNFRITV